MGCNAIMPRIVLQTCFSWDFDREDFRQMGQRENCKNWLWSMQFECRACPQGKMLALCWDVCRLSKQTAHFSSRRLLFAHLCSAWLANGKHPSHTKQWKWSSALPTRQMPQSSQWNMVAAVHSWHVGQCDVQKTILQLSFMQLADGSCSVWHSVHVILAMTGFLHPRSMWHLLHGSIKPPQQENLNLEHFLTG